MRRWRYPPRPSTHERICWRSSGVPAGNVCMPMTGNPNWPQSSALTWRFSISCSPPEGIPVVVGHRVGPFDLESGAVERFDDSLKPLPVGPAAGLVVAGNHVQNYVHVVDADLFEESQVIRPFDPVGTDTRAQPHHDVVLLPDCPMRRQRYQKMESCSGRLRSTTLAGLTVVALEGLVPSRNM